MAAPPPSNPPLPDHSPLLHLEAMVSAWWVVVLAGALAAAVFPISPSDVLPLLPRQLSRPLLAAVRDPADLLPGFVGAVSGCESSLDWGGPCFSKNRAWLELHNKSGAAAGGGTLHIITDKARSWTCIDLYVIASPYRATWDYYFWGGEHALELGDWEGEDELEYVKNKGVSIFLMASGMVRMLRALEHVFPLFTSTGWDESSNINFLEEQMGAIFENRPQPWVSNISIEDVHTGDLLVISKLRGRWGAFQSLEKWVTGSYAGHSAVLLKDSAGKLWVGEAGYENEKGEQIVALLPWDKWWNDEVTKDKSMPHIALLPLHPEVRAKFDETAAWEYTISMEGKPYEYHNMIFSWIDTAYDNYPLPLDAHAVASFMIIWNHLQRENAPNLWNEALNKRLGTKDLDTSQIFAEAEKRGMSFGELLTIPERDDWLYSDGYSTSCIAFVVEMYKRAGLFDPIAGSIQANEFTVKDAYTLRFFENNFTRLPQWCQREDIAKVPFCQILGEYKMQLPGYNSLDPYSHMNERCPSLAPEYFRPAYC